MTINLEELVLFMLLFIDTCKFFKIDRKMVNEIINKSKVSLVEEIKKQEEEIEGDVKEDGKEEEEEKEGEVKEDIKEVVKEDVKEGTKED